MNNIIDVAGCGEGNRGDEESEEMTEVGAIKEGTSAQR